MAYTSKFEDGSIPNSITSKDKTTVVLDSSHPFSFVRWVEYNKILFTNISDLLKRYKTYVTNWYLEKDKTIVADNISVIDLYINLLNEIVINYTSADERRFLKNIDPKNSRDLAVAVPFFAEKIKDICLYYATLRDKLQSTALEYNLKGSIFGLEKLIYNEISKTFEAQDLTDLIKTLNISAEDIRNNLLIEIEEHYDTSHDYYDLGTLPASAYAAAGLREQYFDANTSTLKPALFLDFGQAIVDAIESYPFYLIEIGENFSIDYNANASDLNFLKDADFTNNINNNNSNNLKLSLEAQLTKKYMGTDYYYVSTGSTNTHFVSGKLFAADSPFANYLNKNSASFAVVPNETYLKTPKNVGLFFKPDKLGLLNFSNFSFTASVSSEYLSAYALYVFPDPDKYGKVVGGTKQEQFSPLAFQDNSRILKSDYSNSFKQGEVKNGPLLPTYRGYQSREQSLNYSNQGLARYIDPQDFFDGLKSSKWANEDVFPTIPALQLPLDSRTETLLVLNDKTLVQYKSDVYGNEYGLFKSVEPQKEPQDINTFLLRQKNLKSCLIVDGYIFKDNKKGYNFNYFNDEPQPGFMYSGVVLKTTNNMPPGSGYYGSATVPSTYNLGIPSFYLSSAPVVIDSGDLLPDRFCTDFTQVNFDCNLRDGFTFIAASSGFLPDRPSDSTAFNPADRSLYYNILVDAGFSPTAPEFRPNWSHQGTFLQNVPFSATKYDCGYFVTSSFSTFDEPCQIINVTNDGLFLDSYYVDKTQYLSRTIADNYNNTLKNKKSLYEINFQEYGSFYFRNSNSSVIAPVSAALSGVFLKYTADMIHEINNNLINFDVYYDMLQLETENYLIFDQIEFNYTTNKVQSMASNELYITRGMHKKYEKISNVWFNEKDNELIFAKTNISPVLSSSNFKTIYPTIYVLDLKNNSLIQLFPNNDDLTKFSFANTGANIDIDSIDKPIVSYSSESGLYSITYLGKDTSGMFYIFITTFKYLNGILSNIRNTMHKPDMNILHNNFANTITDIQGYSLLGTAVGTVTGGEFQFGV